MAKLEGLFNYQIQRKGPIMLASISKVAHIIELPYELLFWALG
jgi:hypothetical protein